MSFFRAALSLYERLFSLQEFRGSAILTLALGSLILSYYISFSRFVRRIDTTVEGVREGVNVCWPFFQQCRDYIFLETLPFGHSQPVLYAVFFGLLILAAYFLLKRNYVAAHLALVPAYLWHIIVCLVLTNTIGGNYDYYIIAFGTVILFLPHKVFFTQLSLVLFYFLSTAAKNHSAWIIGTYFSSLSTGLPLFPDATIPIWTNLVIGMEMVGAWLLFSRSKILQRSVLAFFVAFHLYSSIMVSYLYPTIVLPMLLIMFGPLFVPQRSPVDLKSAPGWLFVVLIFVSQLYGPLFVQGDAKLTLEGNRYGLYMFESNHQCISEATLHFLNGTQRKERIENINAQHRCDPYDYWFVLKSQCDASIDRIGWTFDHSINGGAFFRIVDAEDVCDLEYRPFRHNVWIKTEHDNPQVVGYPVRNVYR